MGRFSVSGSFFGESKNDPQEKFVPKNKLHPLTSVGRMGRSRSSGSFFGTPMVTLLNLQSIETGIEGLSPTRGRSFKFLSDLRLIFFKNKFLKAPLPTLAFLNGKPI